MRYAADFRRAARARLEGKWGLSLAVSLVAAILGAGGGGFQLQLDMDEASQLITSGGNLNLGWVLRSLGWGAPASAFTDFINAFAGPVIGISLAFLIIKGAVTLGQNLYYINLARRGQAEFSTLFSRFGVLLKSLGLVLYMGLLIFLWSLLLVVPGIIASYRYRLAPYLMAEYPDMGIAECVNESKRLMDGHKGRLFCLDWSFFGWALLCVLSLGIGMLWLNPYTQAANACFYLERTGNRLDDDAPPDEGPEYVPADGPERL